MTGGTGEPGATEGAGRDEDAVARFVERFAAEMTEAGMQRMAARVFAALLADDDASMTSAELGRQLRISPAAVSGAVSYLSQVRMVGRERDPGSRRDRYRLHDPLSNVMPGLLEMLEQQFGQRATWREPERVVEVTDRQRLALAGLDVEVLHAPGHTEGSVMFGLDAVPDGLPAEEGLDRTMVSGDVLFAGSIGRTDLPGGDNDAMQRSLRDVVLPLPDSTLVLTGHGAATTMRRERATNPYLRGLTA